MKKVLLIGDSIRESYESGVRELLRDVAEVYTPNENCRYSKFVLWGMHAWLEELGNPELDVIHWNAGIWDLHRVTADGEVFTSLEEYQYYTKRLYMQMKRNTSKQIWASTIPCSPSYKRSPKWSEVIPQADSANTFSWEVWNRDVENYNKTAQTFLQQQGDVVINNLYALVLPHLNTYIGSDGVHPTHLGADAMAHQVAEHIRALL